MRGLNKYVFIATMLGLVCLPACGSLLNEMERIRAAAEAKPTSPLTSPTVTATNPADSTIGPFTQTYVDVTFSEPINISSITVQSTFGPCTGNLQLSYDGFTTCFDLTLDSSANPRLRFTPTIMPKGLGMQVRTLAGISSTSGAAATPYQSPVGFKFGAPCGLQNCFFSYSTPLMTVASNVSGIFPIRSGSLAGKYLVYTGSGPQTTVIDPIAATSELGPNMSTCFTAGAGAHDFYVSSGTHAGKQLIVRGGNTQDTCLFDPTSGTPFSPGSTLVALNASGDGLSFQPDAGPDNGNTIFLRGNTTNTVFRYTASGGGISNTIMTTFSNIGPGAHAIRMVNGSNPGMWLIFNGSGTNATNYFDQSGPSMGTTGVTTLLNIGPGASSFEVFTGTWAGHAITIPGGGLLTSRFDLAAMATGVAGPALSASGAVGAGGMLLRHPGAPGFDTPLVVHGGNGAGTSLYVPTGGTFQTGPRMTGIIGAGSSKIFMPSAGATGSSVFFVVNGTSSSTSIYLPSSNSFHGSRMPSDMPTLGASAFPIIGGMNNGKTLILGAMGSTNTDTTMYDPIKHEMTQGPSALGMPGSPSTSFVTFEQGPYKNQVLVFRGVSQPSFQVYNPATHAFYVPGGFPSAGAFNNMDTGGVSFPLANDTRIFIVNGNGTGAQTLDQQTGAVVNLGPLPQSVNTTPLSVRFTRPSNAAVKQLIYANTTNFIVIDHATLGSTTSVASVSGAGVQAFVIPSGPQVNKVLIVHGNNGTATSLLDPETNTIGATAANLASCAGTGVGNGSKILPIGTGIHKGKFLLIVGNLQALTCLYDPANHSFSPGQPVSNTASPGYMITNGSVAFPTGGGFYPTSFVLVSGATSNVWSTYVP